MRVRRRLLPVLLGAVLALAGCGAADWGADQRGRAVAAAERLDVEADAATLIARVALGPLPTTCRWHDALWAYCPVAPMLVSPCVMLE